jgi:hypothetical protein
VGGALCGELVSPSEWEVDHRIPFCYGGGNEPANLQIAYLYCNRQKGHQVDPMDLLRSFEGRYLTSSVCRRCQLTRSAFLSGLAPYLMHGHSIASRRPGGSRAPKGDPRCPGWLRRGLSSPGMGASGTTTGWNGRSNGIRLVLELR